MNHAEDKCQSCPAEEFSCEVIDQQLSSVDAETNILEVQLVPGQMEVTSAVASGSIGGGLSSGDGGLGGGGSGVVTPIEAEASIEGDRLTFSFAEAAGKE